MTGVRAQHRQRGIALLLAVLMTALAALLAFAILDAQAVTLQRTRALQRGAQLDEFARGVEAIAVIALRRDLAQGAGLDHHGEVWRYPLTLELPQGRLFARMRDQQGCVNVNALANADAAIAAETAQRLARLLRALELDASLAEAIADYVDADRDPRARGAEDLRYLGLRPAYRSADRPLAHVSELRFVAGMDAGTYARLAPDLCALPPTHAINVNTASEMVLRSLSDNIDAGRARTLHVQGNARHAGVAEFTEAVTATGAAAPTPAGLGVASEWFLLESEIEYDGLRVAYWAQLARTASGVEVRARGRGRYR